VFKLSKSLSFVLLILSAFLHLSAFAQTSQFEGFNLHAGLGGISQTVFKSDMVLLSNPQAPVSSPANSSSAPLINLGAGYNKALSEQYTIGVEFNISARDSKHLSSVSYVGPYAFGSTIWNTNQYTVSLAPGYLLSPQTLLYAKFGLMKTTSMCVNDNGQPCNSNHLSGQNVGLGVKFLFNNSNNYFYMEGNKNQLFSTRLTTASNPVLYSINGSTLNVVMGLGHHFH
jgi:Outer membrane protein beta-barrel domain